MEHFQKHGIGLCSLLQQSLREIDAILQLGLCDKRKFVYAHSSFVQHKKICLKPSKLLQKEKHKASAAIVEGVPGGRRKVVSLKGLCQKVGDSLFPRDDIDFYSEQKENVSHGNGNPNSTVASFLIKAGTVRQIERSLFKKLVHKVVLSDEMKPPLTVRTRSNVLRENRVSNQCSLWRAAVECIPVVDSLEKRLEERAGKRKGGNESGKHESKDFVTKKAIESMALKRVKLSALKKELTVQLETVKELEMLICNLETEISDEQEQICNKNP